MASTKKVTSGAKVAGIFTPVNIFEIGNPGQPTEVIIHNGKVYVYNATGQTLIDGGMIETNAIKAGDIIVALNVGTGGTGYVRIDGANNRIIVNDGTNNRIVIGNI